MYCETLKASDNPSTIIVGADPNKPIQTVQSSIPKQSSIFNGNINVKGSLCCESESPTNGFTATSKLLEGEKGTTMSFQGRSAKVEDLEQFTTGYTAIEPLGSADIPTATQMPGLAAQNTLVGEYRNKMGSTVIESEDSVHALDEPPEQKPDHLDAPEGLVAMTAYGAVPLPDNVLEKIPEHYYTQPIIQERDVFIMKPEVHERHSQKSYTEFEHKFIEVKKEISVNRIVPEIQKKTVVFPRYEYKPIIEHKVMEIPQGVKYVEVPIEIPMKYVPKIVPCPKPYVIERLVHETKPVIQEKEVEEIVTIKRRVPKIITKDIPYVVPKYVEHIIEVPYNQSSPGPLVPGTTKSIEQLQDEANDGLINPPPLSGANTSVPQWAQPNESCLTSCFQKSDGIKMFDADVAAIKAAHMQTPWARQEAANSDFDSSDDDVGPSVTVKGDTAYVDAHFGDDFEPQTIFVSPGVKNIKVPFECDVDVEVVKANLANEPIYTEDTGKIMASAGPVRAPYNGPLPCCHSDCCQIACCNGKGTCLDLCCGIESDRRKLFNEAYTDYTANNDFAQSSVDKNQAYQQFMQSGYAQPVPPKGATPSPYHVRSEKDVARIEKKYGPDAIYGASLDPMIARDGPAVGSVYCRMQQKGVEVLTTKGPTALSNKKPIPDDITSPPLCCPSNTEQYYGNADMRGHLPQTTGVPQYNNGSVNVTKILEASSAMRDAPTYAGLGKIFASRSMPRGATSTESSILGNLVSKSTSYQDKS